MVIGFTIVAAPLLFAIVNAAVQMNRLSNRSEQLVVHGVQGSRNNQNMFEEIGALERTARLYQIIGNTELLDGYTRNHDRLTTTVRELLTLPLDAQSQADAHALLAEADRAVGGAARRASQFPPHGGRHQWFSAPVGNGVQRVEPHQRPNRPRIGRPGDRR